MNAAKRWIAHVRLHTRRMGLRGRLLLAALVALTAAGALWLAREAFRGQPSMVPVASEPLAAQDLAAARDVARAHGIPHRLEAGRLLAASEHVEELRVLLACEGLLPQQGHLTFDQLARENDLWRSSAQNAKRWQAAKMAVLSDLIKRLPAVRDAAVLFEMGSARGLGREAERPTAAVKVTLAAGQRMTSRLAAAIADLVAGSISGMRRQDVRIVDGTGRSWRLDDAGALDDPIEKLRQAEAYYAEKLRQAVGYAGEAVVLAGVGPPDGSPPRCTSASVSVPRSYLAAAYRCAHAGREPNDAALERFAAAALVRVRRSAAMAAGLADANAVAVAWHYDTPPAADVLPSAPALAAAPAAARCTPAQAAAAALLVAGLACGVAAAVRRRGGAGAPQIQRGPSSAPAQQAEAGDPLAFLRRLGAPELAGLLQGEHSQTTALVLSNVEAAVAAGVLAQLPAGEQVDVARRIAELERVDPAVAAEVAGELARRVASGAGAAAGGAGKVARILHHAGHVTEMAVLDGLEGRHPALAEQIRRSMFVFEDLALLPPALLSAAMETVRSEELAVALRTAGGEVRAKVLGSLPREMSRQVQRQMDEIGPVRLSDVEAAQDRVVAAVRRLEAGRYVSAAAAESEEVLA